MTIRHSEWGQAEARRLILEQFEQQTITEAECRAKLKPLVERSGDITKLIHFRLERRKSLGA